MELWLIAFLFLLLLVLICKPLLSNPQFGFEYEQTGPLLTPAEYAFYTVLASVIPSHYQVMCKVRIADVLRVKKGLSPGQRQTLFNKISAKHFDFVICNKGDMSVALCIELNDNSHMSAKSRKRDTFVSQVCRSAQLELIMVKAQQRYSAEKLQSDILSLLPQDTGDKEQLELVPEMHESSFAPKLSSSKMAKRRGLTTEQFLMQMQQQSYLEMANDDLNLTTKGLQAGAEKRRHHRFGSYFLWPQDIGLGNEEPVFDNQSKANHRVENVIVFEAVS